MGFSRTNIKANCEMICGEGNNNFKCEKNGQKSENKVNPKVAGKMGQNAKRQNTKIKKYRWIKIQT